MKLVCAAVLVVAAAVQPRASRRIVTMAAEAPKRILVLGGSGFVGREVCRRAVRRGWSVTSLSRRGINPVEDDPALGSVSWKAGDAADAATVKALVQNSDAVVHAIGLLFDVESGLQQLSPIVSGSKSVPGPDSTYDRISRLTAFNAVDAAVGKLRLPFSRRVPFAYVSCAEAGWPGVQFGDVVEERLAPEWLKKYLVAKRAVEAKLGASSAVVRPIIYRPSLIWNWSKFDVLPIIPIFDIASKMGVPFVDRTMRVEALADAIVAGVADESVEGVQRYMQMDELAAKAQAK